MDYTRNSDLEYYNNHPAAVNCGSYALRLNEWYDPEDYFENTEGDVYAWTEELIINGYDDYDISLFYRDILVEGMLLEFEGELEVCDGRPPSTLDTELIAFNTFVIYDYEEEYADVDFHFKVYRNGQWLEKQGMEPVKFCDPNDWGRYIGEPIYLYHHIGGCNE